MNNQTPRKHMENTEIQRKHKYRKMRSIQLGGASSCCKTMTQTNCHHVSGVVGDVSVQATKFY